MNVFCDHCVPADLVQSLRSRGHRVLTAREAGLARASDEIIFQYAVRSKRLLLTLDHDFGNITRFPIRQSQGVVIVYVGEMSREQILSRTQYLFQTFLKNRSPKGTLFILGADSIRIWPK